MSAGLNTMWQIALADWRERSRRYPFAVQFLLCAWLAFLMYSGKAEVTLGETFGYFNSAWCAAVMAIMANTLLTLFGFFVVKNSIARDESLGVGRLLASMPIRDVDYLAGKTVSNFLTLLVLSVPFLIGAPLFQLHQRGGYPVQPLVILNQFLLLVLPTMALVAALAVLWECIPLLRTGVGNVLYVMAWAGGLASTATRHNLGSDTLGYALFMRSTRAAELAQGVATARDFELNIGHMESDHVGRFLWNGIDWNIVALWSRLEWLVVAAGLCLLCLFFFKRFNPDYEPSRAGRRWNAFASRFRRSSKEPSPASDKKWAVSPLAHLSSFDGYAQQFQFLTLLRAELRLMLRSVPKVAYVAVGLANFIVMVIPTKEHVNLLPLLWLLPILLWSQMGTRERTSNTGALVFSAPHSFLRQLPALWAAGVLVAVASAIGMFVRAAVTGNTFMMATCVSGAFFIPSLALACGVWSNTPRLFEALYALWWYLALNGVVEADYLGITAHGSPVKYLALAVVLLGASLARRWWDVERGPAQQLLSRVG